MNWFRNITIRNQLIVMYLMMAVTCISVCLLGIAGITSNMADGTSIVIMLCILVLGFALSAFIWVRFTAFVVKPLNEMIFVAQMLAIGNMKALELDANIVFRHNSKNEIEKLAISYDKMVNSTKKQERVIQSIAQGDLTTEVEIRSEDDLLCKGLRDLVESLNRMMGAIITAADQVASGAGMVSDSSQSLAQGASEQAASVEEIVRFTHRGFLQDKL